MASQHASPLTKNLMKMAIFAIETYNINSTSNLSLARELWGDLEYMWVFLPHTNETSKSGGNHSGSIDQAIKLQGRNFSTLFDHC